jgi:hypothetical protein
MYSHLSNISFTKILIISVHADMETSKFFPLCWVLKRFFFLHVYRTSPESSQDWYFKPFQNVKFGLIFSLTLLCFWEENFLFQCLQACPVFVLLRVTCTWKSESNIPGMMQFNLCVDSSRTAMWTHSGSGINRSKLMLCREVVSVYSGIIGSTGIQCAGVDRNLQFLNDEWAGNWSN